MKPIKTAREILQEAGLPPPPPGQDRYYTICPRCSHQRSTAHRKLKCLGISITAEGVKWGCNHCDWKGGGYFNGKDDDPIIATYDYTDEGGQVLFRKVRTAAKKFWQQHPDGHGGWVSGIKNIRRVLYRLPELIEAIATERTVLVVEGERDVNSLHKLNVRQLVIRKVPASPERNRSGERNIPKHYATPISSSSPTTMTQATLTPMPLPNNQTALPKVFVF